MRDRRVIVVYLISAVLLALLFMVDIATGSSGLGPVELFQMLSKGSNPEWNTILINFRIPRALTAILVGVALSLSGLQMQTVFRNPLAGPYVLGISSGASLGVAILMLGVSGAIGYSTISLLGNWSIVTAAWIGSGLVLLLVMAVSVRVRDIMTVLILGIMFASAISAIVSIMQYFSSETMLKTFVIWTMGSLGNLSWVQLKILIISVVAGSLLSVLTSKRLDALMLGEEYAASLGLNIKYSRIMLFISTSILAGSITAFCGPIAFIGIAVPHITRLVMKRSSHKYLIPASALIGAIVMLAGDIISQLPGSELVLPINSVTALIGIPVMIWVIVRKSDLISIS